MRRLSRLSRPSWIVGSGTTRWWLSALLTPLLLASGCHSQTPSPPAASPSPASNRLCTDVPGSWDDKSKRCTLTKDANGAHIEVKASYPVDLVENPTAGPVLAPFVQKFFTDYGRTDNGAGDANLAAKVLTHAASTKTVIFHADWYFSSMPHPGGQITTFTFDLGQNKQLQLADLLCPGVDPLKAMPPIARPFVQQPLNGSPFHAEQFEPNRPEGEYADNYQAWALDGHDLILYMPAGRGPGGVSPGFITPRIPLAEFAPILREKGCSAPTTQPS
jgi:hypothetical protein